MGGQVLRKPPAPGSVDHIVLLVFPIPERALVVRLSWLPTGDDELLGLEVVQRAAIHGVEQADALLKAAGHAHKRRLVLHEVRGFLDLVCAQLVLLVAPDAVHHLRIAARERVPAAEHVHVASKPALLRRVHRELPITLAPAPRVPLHRGVPVADVLNGPIVPLARAAHAPGLLPHRAGCDMPRGGQEPLPGRAEHHHDAAPGRLQLRRHWHVEP